MLHFVKALRRLPALVILFVLTIAYSIGLHAQQSVDVGATEIGGIVTSSKGPEAGVWVIAETTDLPTKFARIVVTDDQGRYLIPDLPTANYSVWVRGYGLVDSPKMRAKPGITLDLTAVLAPNEAAAAHYYPAIYWYTMMKIPPASEFGGKSDIPEKHHAERLAAADEQCRLHWLPSAWAGIDAHDSGSASANSIPARKHGMRRMQSGQSGEQMTNRLAGQFGGAPYKYLGEWTDRIAKGELPQDRAAAAARRRAQCRHHFLGMVDAGQISA